LRPADQAAHLEIYLNSVEWAKACSALRRRLCYFHVGATQLTPYAAARWL
jgi:hypothetical protein